nr:MAG TPA: hypothetical protein [Crassvirales sp.]
MDYGQFIFSVLLWMGFGIVCKICLPPFEKKTDRLLKITSWVLTVATLSLCILISYASIETSMNKAVIDYDRGKYKVELKVRVDTVRTIKKCPELYKRTVPYVAEPQPMRFTPPMTWEKEQESQDSSMPYSQLDSLK